LLEFIGDQLAREGAAKSRGIFVLVFLGECRKSERNTWLSARTGNPAHKKKRVDTRRYPPALTPPSQTQQG